MMTRKADDRELQRYHDGELSPRRARRVRQQLDADSEARSKIVALERMGALLRTSAESAADDADFGHLWAGVQAGIAARPATPFAEGVTLWLRRWGLVLAASAAAAAVAATILIRTAPAPTQRNDAVIESLDVGAEAVGTIFTIAGPGKTGPTTVIWVNEGPAEGDN